MRKLFILALLSVYVLSAEEDKENEDIRLVSELDSKTKTKIRMLSDERNLSDDSDSGSDSGTETTCWTKLCHLALPCTLKQWQPLYNLAPAKLKFVKTKFD